MIVFGLPWVLAAGVGLAGAALLLHLVRPRPPARAPLPTARFLREDARTHLRVSRIPSDVPLLMARMLLAVLLGALFAAPRWAADRPEGTTRVVLLDRGSGMSGAWDAALTAARAELDGAPGRLLVPFDAAAGEPMDAGEQAALDALRPAAVEASYLAGLRGLRGAALEAAGTRRVEAVLVTRPRWGAWDPQLAALRTAAWPGGIRVVDVGSETPGSPPTGPVATGAANVGGSPIAALPDPSGRHRPARAALETIGYEVVGNGASASRAGLVFVASDAPDLPAAVARASDGDTVVVFGAAATDVAILGLAALWDADGWIGPHAPPHALRVGETLLRVGSGAGAGGAAAGGADGPGGAASSRGTAGGSDAAVGAARADGDQEPAAGAPAGAWAARQRAAGAASMEPPARPLPVVWGDGLPAAAALATGAGCLVRFGGSLEASWEDPSYPALLRALAGGCRDATALDGGASSLAALAPLDAAAAALLRGEGQGPVPVAALGEPEGASLAGWLLLGVALAALAETALAARGRRAGATA